MATYTGIKSILAEFLSRIKEDLKIIKGVFKIQSNSGTDFIVANPESSTNENVAATTINVNGNVSASCFNSTSKALTITNGIDKTIPVGTSILGKDGIGIRGAGNDGAFIRFDESTTNSGYLDICTGDDGTEPIYCKQYNTSNAIAHQITLMNTSGNQVFNEATVSAIRFRGNTVIGNSATASGTNYLTIRMGSTYIRGFYFTKGTTYATVYSTLLPYMTYNAGSRKANDASCIGFYDREICRYENNNDNNIDFFNVDNKNILYVTKGSTTTLSYSLCIVFPVVL